MKAIEELFLEIGNHGVMRAHATLIQEAREKYQNMITLLRDSEWKACDDLGLYCWCCGESKKSGHAKDCKLDKFLRDM